jgi:hypothetical protein
MSYQAVQWALHDAPMLRTEKGKPDSTARFVLVDLAEHAHDDGTSTFPSPLHIQWATGLDERTVDRALRRLEKAGLIARDGTTRAGAVRWKLALELTRPESDWAEIEAARAAEREATAARVRRHRAKNKGSDVDKSVDNSPEAVAVTDSASVTAGAVTHSASVRTDSASVRNALSVRDVTHAAPPEPSVGTTKGNHHGTLTGGTLPPDPLRPEHPSGTRNEQDHSPLVSGIDQSELISNHQNARARETPTACPKCRNDLQPDGFCLKCSMVVTANA